jgi:hypothetical protein
VELVGKDSVSAIRGWCGPVRVRPVLCVSMCGLVGKDTVRGVSDSGVDKVGGSVGDSKLRNP